MLFEENEKEWKVNPSPTQSPILPALAHQFMVWPFPLSVAAKHCPADCLWLWLGWSQVLDTSLVKP